MVGEPKHKGVGVLGVVKGLKANPRAAATVPKELAHYLSQVILPTAWYPEREYNVLIELLARSVDRKAVGGDVWGFFGQVAAQRDIAGEQKQLPAKSRTDSAGIYRRFRDGDPDDVAGIFTRVVQLWSLYHDSGLLTVTRHPELSTTVVMRLDNFQFPIRGLLDLQTGYMSEYARLLGRVVHGQVKRSVLDGDGYCEWHYRAEPTERAVSSIANLPVR